MSLWLQQLEDAQRRPLEPDELTNLRHTVTVTGRVEGLKIGVDISTLMSLLGSYERSHVEPGATEYTKALRELLGRSIEVARKARDLADREGYPFGAGYLEAALALLRDAQRQAI